jgi:hypothetical protein
MYLRISHGHFDTSRFDEVAAALQGATAVRQLPGYQSSCWGLDQASGALVALSTWDTRQHAMFSRTAANPPDRENMLMDEAGFRLGEPEVYELVVQDP